MPTLAQLYRPSKKHMSSSKASAKRFAYSVFPVIRTLQKQGITTLSGLARALNDRGIPTSTGGKWYPGAVRNILDRIENGG